MKLVLADLHHDSLKPLTETRSVADIEVGGSTIQEHIERKLEPEKVYILTPDYLEDITQKNSELFEVERELNRNTGDFILYNSGVIPNSEIEEKIRSLENGEGIFYNGKFVAGKVEEETSELEEAEKLIEELDRKILDREPVVLEYPWHLFQENSELIKSSFSGGEISGEVSEEAVIEGDKENMYVGEGAEIHANAYIDTTGGPVHIGENTEVFPNSRIEGPVYIGSNTDVGVGENAVVHKGVHIGDVCRIGGEVEEAVIHSFTNKYHYGFLGHTAIGSWINFGAGTTNSDLKNTYGPVKVQHSEEGELEAGLKIGAMIGDHCKFGINTSIYTGKIVEPCCFIAGNVDRELEKFTWFVKGKENEYMKDKAVEQAERMMSHREEFLPHGYIEAQKNLLRELAEE
jgi:UDP-N-acetylglucosamine diphosphorylase/glucosamine-1-phosphate N-acetyltransferase